MLIEGISTVLGELHDDEWAVKMFRGYLGSGYNS